MARMQAKTSEESGTPGLRKVVDNQSVGEMLRNGRLALGEDLGQVADGLKIRRAFIEALENDEFGALPGNAYGIGFARAYADYLDLNSDEIVELYKAQSRVFNDQTQLVFPEPMPGSRVPTGLVIILSLLLIGAAYGGWSVLSDENRSISDLVPAVPEFLTFKQASESENINEVAPSTATDTTSVETAAVAEPSTDPVTQIANDAVEKLETAVETAEINTTVPVESLAAVEASDEVNATEIETTTSATEDVVSAVTSEPEVSDFAATESLETVGVTSDESVAESELVAGTASDPVVGAAEETQTAIIPEVASGEVTIYGETEGFSRVSIIARQAAWVEISDAQGVILLNRLLLKGDIYQAPDRSGLMLVTGNAGGLEFRVDGETVPDIGPIGSVQRDVVLSPDELKAGTAAVQD